MPNKLSDKPSRTPVMAKWEKSPETLVALFSRILPRDPALERKTMFGYPCAFINGNMFSGLFGRRMFVRLSEDERSEMIGTKGAAPFEPLPGRVMKEYVVVPPTLLGREAALKRLVVRSLGYAKSLKPKVKKPKNPGKKAGG